MILSYHAGLEPARERRKLKTLTRKSLQTLQTSKDIFDHDHPEHSRTIEGPEFWEIARRKTLEKLSLPLWATEAMSGSAVTGTRWEN